MKSVGSEECGQWRSQPRLDFGPGYRLHFGRDGETLIIAGGTKSRQQRDIKTARRYWKDDKRRERGGSMTERKKPKPALTGSVRKSDRRLLRQRSGVSRGAAARGDRHMLSGDVDTGKTILRDYIKATVGFEKLGEATGTPPKSLIRMFGPRGNPQARNLFSVIGYLQKRAGLTLRVVAGKKRALRRAA